MLIHLQASQSSLKNRLTYLLEGTRDYKRPAEKVEVLYGDVEVFRLVHQNHSRKVRFFNLLISFAESKEELEAKLKEKGKTIEELHDEILSYVLPYSFKEVNFLTIAHSDTNHYHWHVTVDNQHLETGKALYLPKTKLTIRLYEQIRRYVSAKYGISLGTPQPFSVDVGTKKLIEKLKEKGKEGTTPKKEQIKRLITEQIKTLIVSGDVNSRKDVEEYLEQVLGLEINRRGRKYVSIRYGKAKIRLSGGIYDEQRFRQLAEEIRRGEEKDLCESPERVGELEKELQKLVNRIRDLVKKRNRRNTQKVSRGKELSSDDRYSGIRERALVNTGNPASNQVNNKELEDSTFGGLSRRIRFRSDRGMDGWKERGRVSVSEEVGRVGKFRRRDEEEIQADKPGMVKEVGRSERKRQAGGYSLSRIAHSNKKEREWLGSNVRRQRQGDYILRPIRPSSSEPIRSGIDRLYSKAVMDWELQRQEELEAVKRLPPEVILQDLGIEAKKVGRRLCIYAPWREETKPSVFIEQKLNGHYVWKDFGSGKGGTWIDFFMELHDWDYVETVKYLRERYLGADVELVKETSLENTFSFGSRKCELVGFETKKVSHPALKRYLKERAITKIPKWLKEVHYWIRDKETGEKRKYFALGVKTTSGSWILRNPLIKMNLKTAERQKHSFAYVPNGSGRLVIVEGLFDALSMNQITGGKADLLILGGVGQARELLASGILEQYNELIVATDSDEAGERFFTELFEHLVKNKKKVKLRRLVFASKDVNEAIVRGQSLQLRDHSKELWELLRENSPGSSPYFGLDV